MQKLFCGKCKFKCGKSAYTATWLLYLLGKHSDKQQDIHNEIQPLTSSEAVASPLVRGSLREALRLYPVAPFITRYLPDDIAIDGYLLRKEDLVIMSLYSSGRESSSFPNPLDFEPSRWTREGRSYKNVIRSEGSLPFAMGPRSCIGRKIAETQIALTISKILKEYKISVGNKKDVEAKLLLITVPADNIQLQIQKRLN